MFEKIRAAVEHIRTIENTIIEKANILRSSKQLFREGLEKELISSVSEIKINGLIGAVDGGLLAHEMHGTDLVIARAVGAIFQYKDSVLVSSKYFPNPFPEAEYEIKLGLDEREAVAFRSLFRLKNEISCAIKMLNEQNLKYLLLDGSLLPLPSDKPNENSEIINEYYAVIQLYKKLYDTAQEKKCSVIGVIKDSRSRRFVDIVKTVVEGRFSDSLFLTYLLKENEKTFAFNYSSDGEKHPIARDFGNMCNSFHVMYLKPVEDDRPLRIEFFSQNFNEIAELIHSLSKINRNYAYPAILIEADLRAALNPIELERAQKSLLMQTGMKLMPLRKNSRPFR